MTRKISIGWFKQKSGRYALKGITICEDDRAFDSTSTFRDEDARWVTKVLGAEADVELSGNTLGERTADGSPEWALKTGQDVHNPAVPALDWERANGTLLRHFLGQIVASCYSEGGSSGCQKLAVEINTALLATDIGTFYTLDEARALLNVGTPRSRKPQKQITMPEIPAEVRTG